MKLNKAGMTGFILCLMAIIFGIATNGGIKTVINFLHIPSFILTTGGALCAVLTTSDSFKDFWYGLKGFLVAFEKKGNDIDSISQNILDMAEVSRKEGLLALEDNKQFELHPFLSKGIDLVVDGAGQELIKDLMETETTHRYEREKKRVKFWNDFGAYAPAWGMVGTLIGLINMMKGMGNDPSAIGPAMSLALITTLYGSIIANWICIPIARKLEKNCEMAYLEMELMIEGTCSIQAGENPRMIKEKLKAIVEKE